jgi:malate dehydrogenase (oxaloacetate-decarboxylating)
VLLQWEDFASCHALPILDRYRDQLLTFNDDIQGTAAVATAALSAAAAATETPMHEQRVVMLGAGSAGVGVCEQIVRAMVADGLTERQARARVFVVDVNGLLTNDRSDLSEAQRRLAQPMATLDAWRLPATSTPDLASVVDNVHPTALLGLSATTGAFTRAIVAAMATHVDRPVIMPLSNPTSHSEADPQDLADWTDGRALVATGSPFPAMRIGDARVPVAQCNNVYIFPGVGLATIATRATRITDAMLTAAADAVGRNASIHQHPYGALLPGRDRLREVTVDVACAVAHQAVRDGVAAADDADIEHKVRATMWQPTYRPSAGFLRAAVLAERALTGPPV